MAGWLSTDDLEAALAAFPRVPLLAWATPVERLARLGHRLGVDFRVKRDDLTGLAFGGNKVRQLEYYLGAAVAAGADSVLITGAVQSNFVRLTAACAARLGLAAHVQLEERVPDVDATYRSSGNVLLSRLLGAELHAFPRGDDEAAADAALARRAAALRDQGRRPFVIPLGLGHPPLGALGYVRAAGELLADLGPGDVVVVGSGSGQTHAGLLFGLRSLGWRGRVLGVCVRRAAPLQHARIRRTCKALAELTGLPRAVSAADVEVADEALAPGYGQPNPAVSDAIGLAARLEGLLLDPVYTGRVMAGLSARVAQGDIAPGARVLMIHTGGLPALFAYARDLEDAMPSRS